MVFGSVRDARHMIIQLILSACGCSTVTSAQKTGISAVVDKQFNEAYNISLNAQDLPHVRWGRIDYLNVTRLTTKWAVWRSAVRLNLLLISLSLDTTGLLC